MDRDLIGSIREVIREEVSGIKEQQKENSLILKALEENSKVHGAKLESLDNRLGHVEGHIKRMDNNIKKIEDDIRGMKDTSKRTSNIANLALNNAAQNRLDIADLREVVLEK